MPKLIAFALLFVGIAVVAPLLGDTVVTPEISPALGMNAAALISGSVLILRSRRKK